MNAYELADRWDGFHANNEKYWGDIYSKDLSNMLRQQADRIAELEKVIQDGIKTFGEIQNQRLKDKFETPQTKCLDCGKINPAEIHTCSPQKKPLSDEEIDDCVDNCFGIHAFNLDYEWTLEEVETNGRQLARAIEAKVRGQ